MILQTHEAKIAHLLRRTGFTANQEQVDELRTASLPEIVDRLLNAPPLNPQPPADLTGENPSEAKQKLQRWWLGTMLHSPNPLQEKMTLFWHGHFTSAIYKVKDGRLMARQNQLLRQYALGNFRELAYRISIDPAMLVWLDNQSNVKKSPNENYAREFLELFTLGIGHYTETDVKEAARAFTGWKLDKKTGQVTFQSQQHDNGSKTILGKTGKFGLRETVDLVMEHPACARFIARKLWSFFAYPNPADEVITPVADAFARSGFEISAALRAIFNSGEFYSDRAYRSIVKNPAEYVVGILALLPQAGQKSEKIVLQAMSAMGQELFNPPNVAGWPDGPAWLNTSMLLARCNFVEAVVESLTPNEFPLQGERPGVMVEDLLQRVGLADASQNTRLQLQHYAEQTMSDRTALMRGLLHLSLISPEAQLK
ncbi:DUF1800 domain-containing protein [Effusibacillus pohliae]|uniref:DUF1800 domain-containing protein n=1 Tax=Effusibacillus pohliae TaxID=232270 RepID=UPI00036E02F6|nr:DUF1800 domain-containing protein [Effusibacillus pohliae]